MRTIESEPAWGQSEPIWEPHRAAFWLFAILLVFGVLRLGAQFAGPVAINPGATSLAAFLWTLYTLPFVWFIVRLDLLEPEPVPFLAAAAAWGGIVATSLAFIGNHALATIIYKIGGTKFVNDWGAAITGPTVEEVLKALGVVVIVLIAARQLNTLLDGLIYGAFVGLAFQIVEDFWYSLREVQHSVTAGADASHSVLRIFLLRGLGGGLWSHAVYTAIVGIGIAYFLVRPELRLGRRLAVAGGCFAAAWLLHFAWNSPWLLDRVRGDGFADYLPIALIKGIPAVMLVVALYRLARRREVGWFDAAVHGESDSVTPAELLALHTMARRRAACRAVQSLGGVRAARVQRRLQQAQVRLAVAVARTGDRGAPSVERARIEVRTIRAALASGSLRPPPTSPWTTTPPPAAEVVTSTVAVSAPPPPAPVLGPAWYPDPLGRFAQRFWDGRGWTAFVSHGDGATLTDPAGHR